jgi:hypothetical protein
MVTGYMTDGHHVIGWARTAEKRFPFYCCVRICYGIHVTTDPQDRNGLEECLLRCDAVCALARTDVTEDRITSIIRVPAVKVSSLTEQRP